MTTKLVNNEDHPTEIYPRNTRNTAVRVRGVRGVPKSNTVPEPVLPVLETLRVLPYPCGTLKVTVAHPETSSYTIALPPYCGDFPTYYASKLKLHLANDAALFPSQENSRPGPMLTSDGLQEHKIGWILDSRPCGRGYQFLVQWKGYGPKDDEWLAGHLLEDCEVLDR